MKVFVYPIVAATMFGVGVPAAFAAPVEFRGAFCLTAVNDACLAVGWNTGCFSTMRFSPPNLGDNGPPTKLSFFNIFFGENYNLSTGNLVGTKYKAVTGTALGRGSFQFTSSMRITTQDPKPSDLTSTSPFVSVIGDIKDFDGNTGCTVSFSGSGTNTQ